MNKMTKTFCHFVSYLNYLPRYGRSYRLIPPAERVKEDDLFDPPVWGWRKNGYWGMNLLDRFGLLWKYIDETNPELEEWRNDIENNGALE